MIELITIDHNHGRFIQMRFKNDPAANQYSRLQGLIFNNRLDGKWEQIKGSSGQASSTWLVPGQGFFFQHQHPQSLPSQQIRQQTSGRSGPHNDDIVPNFHNTILNRSRPTGNTAR